MTFLQIQQLVADLAGLSLDDATTATKIKRWINETYKFVAADVNWPWLFKRDVVQTSTEITTGTVAVTNNSASITFSSAPASSVATDWKIQIQGDGNWYDIATHTGGVASATLADVFLGTTNGTATYTLRRFYYTFPTDLDRVVLIKTTVNGRELDYTPNFEFDSVMPDPTGSGEPYLWNFNGLSASNAWRFSVYPFPSTQLNLEISYYRRITELSSDGDTGLIPDPWNQVLVHGALALFGYGFIDDSREKSAQDKFQFFMTEMKKKLIPASRAFAVKIPWDQTVSPGIRPLRLPDNYAR